MNLFDLITINARSKEVVFSSIFNYFIDPTHDHGLDNLILNNILSNIDCDENRRDGFNSFQNQSYDVEPEYEIVPHSGRIDSAVISYEDEESEIVKKIIGFEIKIADNSADLHPQQPQLQRYLEAFYQIGTEEFFLVYLIPSMESKRCLTAFSNLLDRATQDNLQSRCYLMAWKGPVTNPNFQGIEGSNIIQISYEEILKKILFLDSTGEITPISANLIFLIKSLRRFILDDFRRVATNQAGNFPNSLAYLENIGPHYSGIYEKLIGIFAEDDINIRTPRIHPMHTTIGVAFPVESDQNGALFNIQTCVEYFFENQNPKDFLAYKLRFELKVNDYNDFIDELHMILQEYVERFDGVHPDQNANIPIVIFEFLEDFDYESEEFNVSLRTFVERCIEIRN